MKYKIRGKIPLLKNIKNVMYIKETMSSSDYFQLEIQEDKNILKFIDSKYIEISKNPKVKIIEDELAATYLDKLLRITNDWKNTYENNNIIDGITWQLQITYKTGKVKYYSGKNDFPDNFWYLDKLNYEILENKK